MKKRIRHSFVLGLLVLTALFSLIPTSVFAAGNSAYLTPATGTSQPGNTFTVSVDGFVAASWFGTSSVNGTISFPASLLKVTGIDTSGSTFSGGGTATPDNTAGTITFNGNTPWWTSANNQTVHLFTITFQSIAAGTASVNFGTVQYSTGTAATSGGSYSIVAPAPPPAPSPAPKPSPSPAPKPSTAPRKTVAPTLIPTPVITPVTTPTPENTPAPVAESDGGLKIENVKVTATRQENSVTWTLNNSNASPVLTYGTSKSSQDDAEVTRQDDGTYVADLADLKLGTLYYFTIKAATPDNLQGATYSGTFTTRGYPVQLTIMQNNLQLPGAKVKIGERSFVANKNAIVTTELGDGKYTATIIPPGSTDAQGASFTVAKKPVPQGGNPDIQSFVLNITAGGGASGPNSSLLLPVIGGAVALAAAAAGIIGFIIIRRRQNQEESGSVDADLLTSSYGTSVTDIRTNTPAPNLGALGAMAAPVYQEAAPAAEAPVMEQVPQTPPEDIAPQPYADPALPAATVPAPPAQDFAQYAQPPMDAPQQVDPTGLPLPPVEPVLDAAAATTAVPVAENSYSEDEQLAADISQVEATGEIAEDEPSAVYDASTGELDIIHHHTNSHAAAPAEPEPAAAPEMSAELPAPVDANEPAMDPAITPAPETATGVAQPDAGSAYAAAPSDTALPVADIPQPTLTVPQA